MAEGNGSGRLDRIEALLEAMIEHHDSEFKKLLTWQVLMQDKMDKFQDRMDKFHEHFEAEERIRRETDRAQAERVDRLVSSIGELVATMKAKP